MSQKVQEINYLPTRVRGNKMKYQEERKRGSKGGRGEEGSRGWRAACCAKTC